MLRNVIAVKELNLRAFGAWDDTWFLLTAGRNQPGQYNSMTVSWGALGWIWGRPLAMVVVRPQRHTKQFMDRNETFSLCAFGQAQRPAMNMLGTLSGRDTDKMARCGLHPIALDQIECPGFQEAELILECRKTYFSDLDPKNFLADFIAPNYRGDYHRMYFGEVLAASGTAPYKNG